MMVTTLHKLIGLSVAMLGQAPGTDLLNQWTRLYTRSREDGMDAMAALQKVAQHILDSDAFAEVHPAYLIIDNQDFAQRFLNQVLGATASAEMVTLVVGLLNSGTSRAEVAVRAVEYLLEVNQQGSDHADYATFGTYAMRFGNQVEVARYYTVDKKWMTPGESVLDEVDDTAASVTAAKVSIDGMQQPGKNFTLTTGVDQFTGTPGDDTFVATESTLNGADRLHGKEGMDTLELSSGSGANADISIPIGATVSHIETLSVNSDGDFSGDVSKWEGLKTVQLEVVKDVDLELKADGGTKVTSTSLGDDDEASTVTIENAGTVALKGVSKKTTVKITGEGTESVMVEGGAFIQLGESSNSPSKTIKSVMVDGTAQSLDLNQGNSLTLRSTALESVSLANTLASVAVTYSQHKQLKLAVDDYGESNGGSAFILYRGDIKGAHVKTEEIMLDVQGKADFRVLADQLKMVSVTGTGDLTLGLDNFRLVFGQLVDNRVVFSTGTPSESLETLKLSGSGKFTMDAKGMKKLMTVDAQDATGDVKIDNLGNSVKHYTGSSGKDTVSVAAFNSKGLMASLGAGDDTFTVNNNSGAVGKGKIDGGEGMDTLKLMVADGDKLKGASDAYTNFETITLDAGGGKGTYDLKGLDIDRLMVSSSVGAAAGVTFKNVTPGTDLSLSAATGSNTAAIVNYMLESGAESRFSNRSSTLDLNLHTRGGKNDGTEQAGSLWERGVLMHLTVDDDIDTLVVDSSATLNQANKHDVKAGDYVNRVDFRGEDGIEQIKVTGNARLILNTITTFKYDAGNSRKIGRTSAFDSATKALTALEYVDAKENTGGLFLLANNRKVKMEVHGSAAGDTIIGGSNVQEDDTLLGHGGNDVIIGGGGADKITGGAGGDVLSGNGANYDEGAPVVGYLVPRLRIYDNQSLGTDKDTYIYLAKSDSQVTFDSDENAVSGYDVIVRFDGARDVIDLREVVDLQGTIKNGNHGMDGTEGTSDDFKAKTDGNNLSEFLSDGTGVFETANDNELGNNKHSIVLVDTQEDSFMNYKNASGTLLDGSTLNDVEVKWVLVDVDGDGDFNADEDMVIALVASAGTVNTGNFM